VVALLPLVGLGAAITVLSRTQREQLIHRAWSAVRGVGRSALAERE